MEQRKTVHFVEEEKFGWTILSSVVDADPATKCDDTEKEDVVDVGEHEDEPIEAERNDLDLAVKGESGLHCFDGENEETIKEKEPVPRHEEKANEDLGVGYEGSQGDEGKNESHGSTPEEDHDEDDMNLFYFEDPERDLTWRPRQRHSKYAAKQDLVQHPGPKQGLIWRASLVATLGLFGWAILSGLSGGGKNFRCLKLHPCSIKEGEPVIMNSV